MDALLPEEITTAFVIAEGYGRQQVSFGFEDVEIGTKGIGLAPAGRLRGRLVGPPEAVGGVTLHIQTRNPLARTIPIGLEVRTTDDRGRFEVAELPAGQLFVWLGPDINSRRYVQSPGNLVLEPGRVNEVEVPIREAVRIRGVVRERETGRPIPGAGINLGGRSESLAMTDGEGRFEGFSPPGLAQFRVYHVPDGYAWLLFGPRSS
jgi:hypothetical protein